MVAALAACGGAAPKEPEGGAAESTWLDTGTTWVYADEKGKDYTTRIEGPTVLEGVPVIQVRGAVVGVSGMRWQSADVAYWTQGPNGTVLLHGTGEDERRLLARQPVAPFRTDVERGQAWDGRFYARDAKTGIEDTAGCKFISGGRQKIGTPAGEFDAHWVVEEWRYEGKLVVRIESWWAEKVGIVQQIYRKYNGDAEEAKLHLMLKSMLIVKAVRRGERK
jgi:hypothetical protein